MVFIFTGHNIFFFTKQCDLEWLNFVSKRIDSVDSGGSFIQSLSLVRNRTHGWSTTGQWKSWQLDPGRGVYLVVVGLGRCWPWLFSIIAQWRQCCTPDSGASFIPSLSRVGVPSLSRIWATWYDVSWTNLLRDNKVYLGLGCGKASLILQSGATGL